MTLSPSSRGNCGSNPSRRIVTKLALLKLSANRRCGLGLAGQVLNVRGRISRVSANLNSRNVDLRSLDPTGLDSRDLDRRSRGLRSHGSRDPDLRSRDSTGRVRGVRADLGAGGPRDQADLARLAAKAAWRGPLPPAAANPGQAAHGHRASLSNRAGRPSLGQADFRSRSRVDFQNRGPAASQNPDPRAGASRASRAERSAAEVERVGSLLTAPQSSQAGVDRQYVRRLAGS